MKKTLGVSHGTAQLLSRIVLCGLAKIIVTSMDEKHYALLSHLHNTIFG